MTLRHIARRESGRLAGRHPAGEAQEPAVRVAGSAAQAGRAPTASRISAPSLPSTARAQCAQQKKRPETSTP
jgi:hypothetical protein